jgi:hydroxymethylpyrimidine pyrophosphatase-like HAD family hydrolase
VDPPELLNPAVPQTLRVANLLNDLQGLTDLFSRALAGGDWLNAFLLAAGMNQVLEDHLHRDFASSGRVAARLGTAQGRASAAGARGAEEIDRLALTIRSVRRSGRRLLAIQQEVASVTQGLACVVMGAESRVSADTTEELVERGSGLVAAFGGLDLSLLREVVRLPACFRSFDQEPADLARMAAEFSDRYSDRRRVLSVVGIRTSGSYLAPLLAAGLAAQGFDDVTAFTLRPGRRLWAGEQVELAERGRDGMVLVVDDPPRTGGSVAAAVRDLVAMGIGRASIVITLPVFADAPQLSSALEPYAAVLLHEHDWAVTGRLTAEAVRAGLSDLLGGSTDVLSVEALALPPKGSGRSHGRFRGRVRFADRASGRQWEDDVFVKGVGLGYFGDHTLAVATALDRHVATVYGVTGGLVYRQWLPEECRARAGHEASSEGLIEGVVDYVVQRQQRLPLNDDPTMRLWGRFPAWESACSELSAVFGRGSKPARVLLVRRIVRRLLEARTPSVIDGATGVANWFHRQAGDEGPGLCKIDFDERAFSNLDLYCSDALFDLAGFAASCRSHDVVTRLFDTYRLESGRDPSPERWFLHQVVHLREMHRTRAIGDGEARRAMSAALQRYFGQVLFSDVPAEPNGPRPRPAPICAIDIDGVLEAESLGFAGPTPLSALALRALRLHGYRLVLATGRSLSEVQDRCCAFGLAGGVAEYGAAVYDHATRRWRSLVPDDASGDLEAIRSVLATANGVQVDPQFQHIVRASTGGAHRQGLTDELVERVLRSATSGRIRAIHGQDQTDFAVTGLDKGSGLRILLDEMGGEPSDPPLRFAIGDTEEDVPMLRLASLAFAPSNATPGLQATPGVRVMRRPYRRGLSLAVSELLGHAPGRCPTCQPPPMGFDTRGLFAILSAQEATGKVSMLGAALRLFATR